MNIESLAGFINDGGSNRTRTRNTSSNNTCRNGHRYHHLSLYIPGCAEFLCFFIEKIPVSFRISGFFGSITSRCRGGSDCQRMLADKNLRWEKFQSPRGVGVVQTRTSRFSACRTKCVSITSRCRGGSDCKPTSPHGYAANRNLNFKKTFILFHFCHPFDYILAQFF